MKVSKILLRNAQHFKKVLYLKILFKLQHFDNGDCVSKGNITFYSTTITKDR